MGGKRRVPESEIKRILGIHEERKILGYARVSYHTQRLGQIELIKSKEKGWDIEILKDVGLGLREDRRNFNAKKW